MTNVPSNDRIIKYNKHNFKPYKRRKRGTVYQEHSTISELHTLLINTKIILFAESDANRINQHIHQCIRSPVTAKQVGTSMLTNN